MKTYTALIMDLKKSRAYSITERNIIQKKMMDSLQKLNQVFSKSMEKEVDFSAGDEMQGLFARPEAAYLYLRFFQMMIFPVEIWAGIGIGKWDVVLKNASTTAQDGSSYHNARKAVNEAKKTLEYSTLLYSSKKSDFLVNALVSAVNLIEKKQNVYQNKLMFLSELLYPITIYNIVNLEAMKEFPYFSEIKNQKPIPIDAAENEDGFFILNGKKRGLSTQLSELLEISRQSIEKTIKAANIYELRNLVIAILNTMKDYDGGDEL